MEDIVIDTVRPQICDTAYVTHEELNEALKALESRLEGRQMNVNKNEQMEQLRKDPIGTAKKAGYQIPENLAGNPQAMVMHLIQSGQVSNPMMQRLMPMIRQMTGK